MKKDLKNAKELNLPNPNTKSPLFSFQHIDFKKVKNMQKNEWYQFMTTIQKLEKLKWDEINSSPKEQYGYEHIEIKTLKKSPNNPFKEDKVYVFRYSKKVRFLGYKISVIFYITEIDRTHEYTK